MGKFELEGTSEGLQRPASKCDQVAQALAQARFLNLQGWSFHILSGQPVPEHELIGILPCLQNSISTYFPLFLPTPFTIFEHYWKIK